ncbi:MAG: hypothetical protein WCZ90_18040, partial [Melioribacteraceae bacterium]
MKIDRKFNTKYKQSSDSKSPNKSIYIIAGIVAVISIVALLIYFTSIEIDKASQEAVNQTPNEASKVALKQTPKVALKESPKETPSMEKPVPIEEINPQQVTNNEKMV